MSTIPGAGEGKPPPAPGATSQTAVTGQGEAGTPRFQPLSDAEFDARLVGDQQAYPSDAGQGEPGAVSGAPTAAEPPRIASIWAPLKTLPKRFFGDPDPDTAGLQGQIAADQAATAEILKELALEPGPAAPSLASATPRIPGAPEAQDPRAELITKVDALAERGVGSPGLLAVYDLAKYFEARSIVLARRHIRNQVEDPVAQDRVDRVTAQIGLHEVTIPGYLSARKTATDLGIGLLNVGVNLEQRGSSASTEGEVGQILHESVQRALSKSSSA